MKARRQILRRGPQRVHPHPQPRGSVVPFTQRAEVLRPPAAGPAVAEPPGMRVTQGWLPDFQLFELPFQERPFAQTTAQQRVDESLLLTEAQLPGELDR